MKVGSGIGYTPGSLYKRTSHINYTPGSKYQRFGRFGLLNQRNLSAMNRAAADSYNAAFSGAGPNLFAAKATESQGLSEIAANRVLERVKQQANTIADRAANISIDNGGNGGTEDGTGGNVDETV